MSKKRKSKAKTGTISRSRRDLKFMDQLDRALRTTSGRLPEFKPIR